MEEFVFKKVSNMGFQKKLYMGKYSLFINHYLSLQNH